MSVLAHVAFFTNVPGSKRRDRCVLLVIVALALSVRFYTIDWSPIWYDEAFNIRIAHEAPTQILVIAGKDVHPPLYYFILHYWMHCFGDSVASVRSLGALADIGALLFCLKLLSLVSTSRASCIAALLLALFPFSVGASQEARMYPLLGLWLMAATVVLVCWNEMPERKRYPLMYVLLMSMAFYTHYFAALCVLTHWLFWLQMQARQKTGISLQGWLKVNVAIVLLFLPWGPFLLGQLAINPDFGWIPPLSLESALELGRILSFGSAMANNVSLWQQWPAAVVVFCAVVVVLKDCSESRYSWLLVGYIFVPVIALMLLALFKPVIVYRYFYFAAMAVPLIVAVALDAYSRRHRMLVTVVLLAVVLHEIHNLYAMTRPTPWAARLDLLAANLQTQVQPGDEIVVDSMFDYLPLSYYLKAQSAPTIYIGRFTTKIWGYPNHGAWALIPHPVELNVRDDEALMHLAAKRVWWITKKSKAEDISFISQRWKRQRTLEGGRMEARLYIQE